MVIYKFLKKIQGTLVDVDVSGTPSPYRAKDGNHRVKILKRIIW